MAIGFSLKLLWINFVCHKRHYYSIYCLLFAFLQRVHVFNDQRKSAKLEKVTPLMSFQIEPNREYQCTMQCAAHPQCISINICEGSLCFLNSGDVFTEGTELSADTNCVYIGMKRDEIPACEERSEVKMISDESATVCGVAEKRTDAQWAEWSYEDELLPDEWLRHQPYNLPHYLVKNIILQI